MADDRRYAEIPRLSTDDMLRGISSGVPDQIASSLLSAAWYAESPEWAEVAAVASSNVDDLDVQWAVTLALGHLAYRFGRLDKPAICAIIERFRLRPELAGRLDDLEDDLSTVLPQTGST